MITEMIIAPHGWAMITITIVPIPARRITVPDKTKPLGTISQIPTVVIPITALIQVAMIPIIIVVIRAIGLRISPTRMIGTKRMTIGSNFLASKKFFYRAITLCSRLVITMKFWEFLVMPQVTRLKRHFDD
jgi:hypothetical protein